MKNIFEKSLETINKHLNNIESILSIKTIKVECLSKVLKEHEEFLKEKKEKKGKLLEGIINDKDSIITIYPVNIYLNHCGLLPEPYNWESFNEEIVRVLAHEMRHLWQIEYGTFYDNNAEKDADEFAAKYIEKHFEKN